jgi:hypothetical protein
MVKLNQHGVGSKGKIKTSQNSSNLSSYYLITIDATK